MVPGIAGGAEGVVGGGDSTGGGGDSTGGGGDGGGGGVFGWAINPVADSNAEVIKLTMPVVRVNLFLAIEFFIPFLKLGMCRRRIGRFPECAEGLFGDLAGSSMRYANGWLNFAT
jgi:hypothetical protein